MVVPETECTRSKLEAGGGRGEGISLNQHPGPVVGDVVAVKTVNESISRPMRVDVRRVGLDEVPESMKYADKKSPMLPPSACRRSNFKRNLRCRGFSL